MNSSIRYGIAALAVLSSVSIAAAAGTASPAPAPAPTTTGSAKASDTLKLTSAQERTIYQSASQQNIGMKPPAGFTASVGEKVPAAVKLHPLPSSVTGQISAVRPYEYAMLDKKLLIVNPIDKKVVDIITQ